MNGEKLVLNIYKDTEETHLNSTSESFQPV